jgi:L-ascorbate metabolism protein UlaG (beta-lactamase superfamily)
LHIDDREEAAMQITWLGWAGVEIAAQGERVVIDPLADPRAVFAWLGERADAVLLPEVVAPRPGAIAGLVTHLHRDHADADALTAGDATRLATLRRVQSRATRAQHGLEAAGEACAALTGEPVRS